MPEAENMSDEERRNWRALSHLRVQFDRLQSGATDAAREREAVVAYIRRLAQQQDGPKRVHYDRGLPVPETRQPPLPTFAHLALAIVSGDHLKGQGDGDRADG